MWLVKSVYGDHFKTMSRAEEHTESKSIIPGLATILKDYVASHYKTVESDGMEYGMEFYKKPHANEYALYELKDGKCEGMIQVYRFGLLLYSWNVHNGVPEGDVTEYDNGLAVQTVNWSYYLKKDDMRCVRFTPNGSSMSIVDRSTNVIVYRGDYDRKGMVRSGYGIVCNKDTGKEELYGYFEEDRLVHICQRFLENGVMVEYDNSKEDNTALERQRPVYYGGYAYSEQSGTFVRHGKGRLLHVFTGMTQFEGVWNMGMMNQDGVKYTDGKNDWRINNYSLRELTDKIASNVVSVNSSSSLEKLSSTVSDLTITQGGNDTHLSFSFRCLRTLVLEDMCCSQASFVLYNLPLLKKLSIGSRCKVTVGVAVVCDG